MESFNLELRVAVLYGGLPLPHLPGLSYWSQGEDALTRGVSQVSQRHSAPTDKKQKTEASIAFLADLNFIGDLFHLLAQTRVPLVSDSLNRGRHGVNSRRRKICVLALPHSLASAVCDEVGYPWRVRIQGAAPGIVDRPSPPCSQSALI